MFIENKYKKWYDSIISNAATRELSECVPVEKHHIIPKSLGGSNNKSNIAELTMREHFVCHWLLSKCIESDYDRRRMLHALGKFLQNGPGQNRTLTSRQYQVARTAVKDAKVGIPRSEQTKKKISAALRGNTPWNKGVKNDCRLQWPEERKRKASKTHNGKVLTDEHRNNISKAKLGHTAGMSGKKHTEETKIKMRSNMKGKRGPQQRSYCSRCGIKEATARHIRFCKVDR